MKNPRDALIRLAADLPSGDPDRRAILASFREPPGISVENHAAAVELEERFKAVAVRIVGILKGSGVRSVRIDRENLRRGIRLYLMLDTSFSDKRDARADASEFEESNPRRVSEPVRLGIKRLFSSFANKSDAYALGSEAYPIKVINVTAPREPDGKVISFKILGCEEDVPSELLK